MKALIVPKRVLIQSSFCSFKSFSKARVLRVDVEGAVWFLLLFLLFF